MDAYILGQYIDRIFRYNTSYYNSNIFEAFYNCDRMIFDKHIVINFIFLSDFAQVYRTKK